jgi:hypothetical protein
MAIAPDELVHPELGKPVKVWKGDSNNLFIAEFSNGEFGIFSMHGEWRKNSYRSDSYAHTHSQIIYLGWKRFLEKDPIWISSQPAQNKRKPGDECVCVDWRSGCTCGAIDPYKPKWI